MAHGGCQVINPQLLHQRADAAFREAPLITAAVGILVKVHIPRVGVAVSRLPGGGGFHSGNILGRELRLAALAAEPFHQRRYLSFLIVVGKAFHIGTAWHGEDKRPQHGAANDVHAKPITFFKFGQLCDDLTVLRLGLFRDLTCGVRVIAQYRRQLRLKGLCKHCPYGYGHSHPTHLTSLLSILPESGSSASRCLSGSGDIPWDISLPPETPALQTGRSQPAA